VKTGGGGGRTTKYTREAFFPELRRAQGEQRKAPSFGESLKNKAALLPTVNQKLIRKRRDEIPLNAKE